MVYIVYLVFEEEICPAAVRNVTYKAGWEYIPPCPILLSGTKNLFCFQRCIVTTAGATHTVSFSQDSKTNKFSNPNTNIVSFPHVQNEQSFP